MRMFPRFLLANHIHSGEALCELDAEFLLRTGMVRRRDLARLPAPGASGRSRTLWWYVGDRYDSVLVDDVPILIPGITDGPRSGRGLLDLHIATRAPMTLADVTYLDVTEAASASDFEDRGGLWYHHSIPTQVVHHVAVCCAGPLILGVHLYADLQEARSVVLYFLQEIHGLPDDLTWDEWEAIVASGIAPPGVGQTGVWSARVEPAPHDPAD